MICAALVAPLNPKHGRKIRTCGKPATHLVGPHRLARCTRHAFIARRRGEIVKKLDKEDVVEQP